MKKFVITENEKKEILNLYRLNEQSFLEFAAHETNTGTGWDQGLQNNTPLFVDYSDKEKVKNLFILAKSWSSTNQDWKSVENIAKQIHNTLSGAGSGNFLNLIKLIDTKEKFAALIKNWKYDNKNLFQWLESEYLISWGDIIKSLNKNISKYIVHKKLRQNTAQT
jgi:hypothetical protein